MLSNRSIAPPCPGNKELKSFMPKYLLTAEKVKSPKIPNNEMQKLNSTEKDILNSNKLLNKNAPTKVVIARPPIKPASVLLGLKCGTILRLPKSFPNIN